jgi:hypothetical protein
MTNTSLLGPVLILLLFSLIPITEGFIRPYIIGTIATGMAFFMYLMYEDEVETSEIRKGTKKRRM